jgi:DNA-directed RNA polymerase specialized sigma24 family protein
LNHAERDKGRFRSFILASLTHYLLNEYDRHRTQKRGGRCTFVPFDEGTAEEIYRREATDHAAPENYFERRWAITLIRRALERLRSEYEQRGQASLFSGLQPSLTGEPDAASQDRLAQQLDMTPGALKVALHRARRRFGELLRHEVAYTVSRPEEVEGELRYLFAVITK